MNAKITIAACAFVAAMNHASAAIVEVDTELRALAISVVIPGDPNLDKTNDKTETFSGYGLFSVSAEVKLEDPQFQFPTPGAFAGVTASVQPNAIGIRTNLYLDGSEVGPGRDGTATATVNFKLSEAGVWSAKPLYAALKSWGIGGPAVVLLLRNRQEVYHQDCSGFDGQLICVPYYEDLNGDIVPVPEYAGRSLELLEGDYTLFLTAGSSTGANDAEGGGFAFDLQLVPVPAALPLFLSGLAAFGLVGWRRR